jgi:hypothetical protein
MRTLLLASGFSLMLGGLAHAQVSNSLIYACVNNSNGTIHIVPAGAPSGPRRRWSCSSSCRCPSRGYSVS